MGMVLYSDSPKVSLGQLRWKDEKNEGKKHMKMKIPISILIPQDKLLF